MNLLNELLYNFSVDNYSREKYYLHVGTNFNVYKSKTVTLRLTKAWPGVGRKDPFYHGGGFSHPPGNVAIFITIK